MRKNTPPSRNNEIVGKPASRKGKRKIRTTRQDFRAAVNEGKRRGSGKNCERKFEAILEILCGSPATTSFSFGNNVDKEKISAETLITDNSSEVYDERLEGIYYKKVKYSL